MFAAIDVPAELDDLYARCVALGQQLVPALQPLGEACEFGAGVNILHEAQPGVLIIDDGYLRLSQGGRTVRFFRDGDLISIAAPELAPNLLACDLLTRATWVSAERFGRALAADPALFQVWLGYQHAQFQLMAGICAQYASADHQLGMKLRKAAAGQTLIRQGEQLREVLVMIDGSADVIVDGARIGSVATGEFIGEMSFLTDTVCGATVVASDPCVLQVIDRESFADVIRARPHTMLLLAKTLAERLMRANRRNANPSTER